MQSHKPDSRIFLSLGTNLGDRESNLREALERINKLGLDVVALSSIYETEPVGYADQDWFFNQVIEVKISESRKLKVSKTDAHYIKTFLNGDNQLGARVFLAEALLRKLLKIEKRLGRKRTFKNAPRVIDIDLLLFGDCVISQSRGEDGAQLDLIIPHPRMRERRFVLEPLCEIAPDLIDPLSKKSFTAILASLDDTASVKRLSNS